MISQLIFKYCRIYCTIIKRMYLLLPVHSSSWSQFSKPYIDKKKTPFETSAGLLKSMQFVCRSSRAQFILLERSNGHALNFSEISIWGSTQNYNLLSGSMYSNTMDSTALDSCKLCQVFHYMVCGMLFS